MALYLIHFEQPIGDPTRPHMSAQHYLGFAQNDETRRLRIEHHRRGTAGVAITRAVFDRGIAMLVGWLGEGDQERERRMKLNGHYARRCSVCKGRGPTPL
jgi:hypothetical protein